jgi:hypothetical protein
MGSCLPVETLASMALSTGWSEQPIGLPAVRPEVGLLFATQGVDERAQCRHRPSPAWGT